MIGEAAERRGEERGAPGGAQMRMQSAKRKRMKGGKSQKGGQIETEEQREKEWRGDDVQ